MNAKSIRKRLMRIRCHGAFGPRAYVSVQLPLSLMPPMPEELTFDGMHPMDQDGWWENDAGTEHVSIVKWHTGVDPTTLEHDSWCPVCFPCRQRESWYYWSGYRARVSVINGEHVIVRTALDATTVAKYKALCDWAGLARRPDESCVLHPFTCTIADSFDVFADRKAGTLTYTYGCKWFNPYSKLVLCTELASAIKNARRHGVKPRVLR